MTYSIDLRKKVLDYIDGGASKVDAEKTFKISRRTIQKWLKRGTLEPTPRTHWQGKINKKDLVKYVENNPNTTLFECAKKFGVKISSISNMLKKLKIVKKNNEIQGTRVYKKM